MSRRLTTRVAVEGGDAARREFEALGETGTRALERVRQAAQPASGGLLAVDAASKDLQSSLGRFAGELGPLGRGLAALGPAGLAAGAALGALTFGLKQAVDAAALHEQSLTRLQGVLRATGHASGLTARELDRFAIQLDRNTMASRNAVLEAASALATFRSVGGETFTDTLRLAQDLAAVFGGDLRSQTIQLGKALEDPIGGLTALRRVGVSFTEAQREMIRAMVEAGDVASAQRAILAELERQVGGAGAAEAQGLKGSVDGLTLAWRLLLEEIGRTSGLVGGAGSGLGLLTTAIEGLRALVSGNAALGLPADADIGQRIVATNRALLEAEQRLEQLQRHGSDARLAAQEGRVARLRGELDRLIEEAREEALEKRTAVEGQRAAEADRIAGAVAKVETQLQQRLYELTVDRIQKVRDAEAKALAELAALRAQGADPEQIDRLIAQRREQTRHEIEEIERPARDALLRRAEAEAQAAAARVAANAVVVAGLERELQLLTTLEGAERERQRAIDQAVGRLQVATPETVARVRELAGALFDEARAQQSAAAARDAAARTVRAIDLQWRLVTAAQGGAVDQLARWREETLASLDQAGEGYEAFARQVEDIFAHRLTAARRADLEASREWRDGVTLALADYLDHVEDSAARTADVVVRTLGATEGALVGLFTTGRLEIGRLIDAIVRDLARLAVQQAIMEPLLRGLTGGLGGLFGFGGAAAGQPATMASISAGLYHAGGVVGDPARTREVPASVFDGAARLHRGGWIGPDERPAILQVGERVLSRDEARARPAPVEVRIIDQRTGGGRIETRERRGADGGRVVEAIILDAVEQGIGRGRLDRVLGERFGTRPRTMGRS